MEVSSGVSDRIARLEMATGPLSMGADLGEMAVAEAVMISYALVCRMSVIYVFLMLSMDRRKLPGPGMLT